MVPQKAQHAPGPLGLNMAQSPVVYTFYIHFPAMSIGLPAIYGPHSTMVPFVSNRPWFPPNKKNGVLAWQAARSQGLPASGGYTYCNTEYIYIHCIYTVYDIYIYTVSIYI
jgi:hypothetical protein